MCIQRNLSIYAKSKWTGMVLALCLIPILSQPVLAQRGGIKLAGTWLVTITTGGASFPVFITTHNDGTLIETDTPQNTGFPGVAENAVLSNGHGAWERRGGRDFAFLYSKLIYSEPVTAGGVLGRTQGTATATVAEDGNSFSGTGTLGFLPPGSNTPAGGGAAAAFEGTRIRVQ